MRFRVSAGNQVIAFMDHQTYDDASGPPVIVAAWDDFKATNPPDDSAFAQWLETYHGFESRPYNVCDVNL